MLFFFFQAEDGIRDYKVTGVQTCALPISRLRPVILDVSEPLELTEVIARGPARLAGPSRELGRGGRTVQPEQRQQPDPERVDEIGRASCRERGEVAAGRRAATRKQGSTVR